VLVRKDRGGAPILIGAWFGMLVTMLNLIPIGQLDGGHLTHAWFGPRAVPLGKVLALGMAFLALFYSAGWAVWLLLTTQVVGFKHPQVLQPAEPLSAGRKLICAVCFVCFALTLMPVPMTAS
jgi:membrane-associated protease RseP (regulator of RpoE activity)